MQDRIRHRGGIRLKWFEDEEKAFVISGGQRRKSSNFLERLVILDIGQLKSPY